MTPRIPLRERIASTIVAQLTQGLSPEKLALTVAVGLCIAINPVIGTTTIGCFLAAYALGLNLPVIQLVNFSSYALQLLLIFPFIRLGEWIFGAQAERRSFAELAALTKAHPIGSIEMLGATILHAVVAWVLVAPLVVAAVYFAIRPPLRALARRVASERVRNIDDVASDPGRLLP